LISHFTHFPDPPTYAESVGGAVDLNDDDDDEPGFNMGDLTYTPMYTYVYNYRPPSEEHNEDLTLPIVHPGKHITKQPFSIY
jgi:hypothetical protein